MIKNRHKNNSNKLQKLEKHKAWAKKHRAERKAELWARNDERVKAKKSLGQNFLHEKWVVEKICANAYIQGQNVLEIGPGTGFLTQEICRNNPKKLLLIEKDTRFIGDLRQKFIDAEIINKDATTIDFENDVLHLFGNKNNTINDEKITLIANLPYNVGTTITINFLQKIDYLNEMVLMLQKEVVDRLTANCGSKDYGRISVLIQAFCDVKKLFDVPPECFMPRPKVMSSVVKIIPKENVKFDASLYNYLSEITKIAFSQRRKKLLNVFKNTKYLSILPSDLQQKRAEEVAVEEYIEISRKIFK